jgi:hypothetical protein
MTKRHAKPTSAQLVARMYRKVVAMDSLLTDTIDANGEALDAINSKLALLMERVSSLNPIVDHCARLLKEKETLQKQIEKMREPFKIVPREPVYNVEITPVEVKMGTYTYTGVLGGACTLAHLHRPGIRCGVCGETQDGFSEPARKL